MPAYWIARAKINDPVRAAAYAGGPISGPPGKQAGSSRAPWIALAAVVLIALIVAGLAIGGVFSSDNKSKNTANTSTEFDPAIWTGRKVSASTSST